MFVLGVLEEVKDSLFFHQPRDEIEIGLAVLYAIFARLEGAVKAVGEIGEAVLLENFRDDVGHGEVLKNAAIAGAGQSPEPGDERGVIRGENSGGRSAFKRRRASLRERADDPVEVARRPVGEENGDRRLLADYRIELNRAVFGVHRQLKMKWPGDPLFAVEALQQQFIHAERRVNSDKPVVLCVCRQLRTSLVGWAVCLYLLGHGLSVSGAYRHVIHFSFFPLANSK